MLQTVKWLQTLIPETVRLTSNCESDAAHLQTWISPNLSDILWIIFTLIWTAKDFNTIQFSVFVYIQRYISTYKQKNCQLWHACPEKWGHQLQSGSATTVAAGPCLVQSWSRVKRDCKFTHVARLSKLSFCLPRQAATTTAFLFATSTVPKVNKSQLLNNSPPGRQRTL